jgi:ABC-type nickel/cobalt efflux system permease component RcnA
MTLSISGFVIFRHFTMDNTSSSSKTMGLIIVVLIIILGIWLMMRSSQKDINIPDQYNSTASTTDTTSNAGVDSIQASGMADSALEQDSVSIDAQMQSFAADNTTANQAAE